MNKFLNLILLLVVCNCLLNDVKAEEVSQSCLQCICKASSGCKLDTKCHNNGANAYFCGPYQISWAYWADGGKPGNTGHSNDFEHCLNDKNCAEVAIRGYMTKWQKDCNGDGVVDCLDFAAIHKAGASSCSEQWLYNSQYWNVFRQCQLSDAPTQPIQPPQPTQPAPNEDPWAPSNPQTDPKPQSFQPQPNDPWNQPQPSAQPQFRPLLTPQPQPQPSPVEPYNTPQPLTPDDNSWDQPQPQPIPDASQPPAPPQDSWDQPQPQPQPQPRPSLQPQSPPSDPWNQPQPQPQPQPRPSLQPQSPPSDPWNQPQPQPDPNNYNEAQPQPQPVPNDPWNAPSVGPQEQPFPADGYNQPDPWDAVSRAVEDITRPTLRPQTQSQPLTTDPWNTNQPNQPQSRPIVIPGRAPTQPVSWSSPSATTPSNGFGQPFRPVLAPNRNSQPSSPLIEASIVPINASVEQSCLECICLASSDCDLNKHCEGSYCGPYLISWAYWSDGGQPGGDYVTCSTNKGCAEHAVQGYMNKWQKDCNSDGLIDCTDFALIHKLGPHSCGSNAIDGTDYWTSYQSCKSPSIDARRDHPNPSGDSLTGRSVPQTQPPVNTFSEYRSPVQPNPNPNPGNRDSPNYFARDSRIAFPRDESFLSQPDGYGGPSSPVPPNFPNNGSNDRAFEELGLQRECLDCMCQASSKCNPAIGCQNDGSGGYVCGPYQMNWAYWSDAGKPGIGGNLENLENFRSCLNNKDCAEAAIYGYMKKWKRDCNGDRVVDCNDFAALHMAGPSNCNAQWFLESQYWSDFRECFDFRRRK